jgi:hypothetical protein
MVVFTELLFAAMDPAPFAISLLTVSLAPVTA